MTDVKVIYTANAGVIVEVGQTKVILDGLNKAQNLIYANTPDDLAKAIISGHAPYKPIDAMLYTHLHNDHFSSSMTVDFMSNHTETKLIIGENALEELKHKPIYSLLQEDKTLLISGDRSHYTLSDRLKITAFKTKHMGKEYEDLIHYAFLIEIEGINVVFLGDTDTIIENFTALNREGKEIDVLITPFPYLSTTSGQRFIKNVIKPKKVVSVHIPPTEKDTYKWYDATLKMYEKHMAAHTPAVFAKEFGHAYHIEI